VVGYRWRGRAEGPQPDVRRGTPRRWRGEPVTITPDASLASAVQLMDATRVERLPVVTDDGKLVGTVSRRQVLQASVPPEPAWRDELAGPVLRRVLSRRAP
jgi:CBS-domain-containing membrane protein